MTFRLQVGRGKVWFRDRVLVFNRPGPRVWLSVFDSPAGMLLVFLLVLAVLRLTPMSQAPLLTQALVGTGAVTAISAGGASVLTLAMVRSGHVFACEQVLVAYRDPARYVLDNLDGLTPEQGHRVSLALLELTEPEVPNGCRSAYPSPGAFVFVDVANEMWAARGRR